MSNRHHQVTWTFMLVVILLVFLGGTPRWTSAALPKKVLDSLASSMSKSTDEGVQGVHKLFKRLNLDDIKWKKYGDELAGSGFSEADALTKMRNLLDVTELPSDISDHLKNLTRMERQTLLSLLEDSKRIFKIGTEQGIQPETIYRVVEQGGADAILGLRTMKSAEGMADCIHGFERFGDQFATFVKQGDEGAVRSLMKRADELSSLKKAQLDDILANPIKYFDASGKPTRAFDELFGSVKPAGVAKSGAKTAAKITAITVAAAYIVCPDGVFDFLERFLPESVVNTLRSFQWWIRYGILAGLVLLVLYILWPFLAPILTQLCFLPLKMMRIIPGRLGKLAADRLQAIKERIPDGDSIHGKINKEQVLRLGLLGSRRAGKSTFITMLNEKMSLLVCQDQNFMLT